MEGMTTKVNQALSTHSLTLDISRPHDESADSAHREIEIFLLARLVRLIEPDRMSY